MSLAGPHRIDEFKPGELAFVVGHDDAVVCACYRSDDCVERVALPAG